MGQDPPYGVGPGGFELLEAHNLVIGSFHIIILAGPDDSAGHTPDLRSPVPNRGYSV